MGGAEVVPPATSMDERKPEPANLHLNFPEKHTTSTVEGFDTAKLEGRVTVTIEGKVTRLEASTGEWGGKSLGVDIDTCRIEGEGGYEAPLGLGDAVARSRQRVD